MHKLLAAIKCYLKLLVLTEYMTGGQLINISQCVYVLETTRLFTVHLK